MPDISMCINHRCNKRMNCFRYTAKPSDHWQSYIDPPEDNCTHFIQNKTTHEIDEIDSKNINNKLNDPLDRISNDYFKLAEEVSNRVKQVKSKIKNIKEKHIYEIDSNSSLEWNKIDSTWHLIYSNKELNIYKPIDQCTAKNRMKVGLKNIDLFIVSFADRLENEF